MADVTATQFQQDVNNASEWVNGDENKTVTMRLGQQARSPAKVIKDAQDSINASVSEFESEAQQSITDFNNDGDIAINQFQTSADVAIGALKSSRGYNDVGTFNAGFTYENFNDVGRDDNGNPWVYLGDLSGSNTHVVAPGTVPSSFPLLYEQRSYSDHEELANRNKPNAHLSESITNDDGLTSQDTHDALKATLKAKGLSGNFGLFAKGFTYNLVGDVGIGVDGKIYTYAGSDPLPVNVAPGTDPAGDEDYMVVNLNFSYVSDFEVLDLNYSPVFRYENQYGTILKGIIQTGQSLAEGGVGGGAVTGVGTAAFPERTLMLLNGPMGLNNNIIGPSYSGLIEGVRVTTGHSITKTLATGNSDKFIFSGQAWGGKNYNDLKKGGSSGVYEKCITQVQNINLQVDSLSYDHVTCIHGEQDGLDNNTSYAANLNEWANDFNSDIKSITGQPDNIKMLICQTSTAGGYGFNGGIDEVTFPTPVQQLLAHESYSNVTLVCPKYFLDYVDHAHISNYSQRVLGEYYARAMKEINYEPLSPSAFNIIGSSIVIDFKGNTGQLVEDTVNVNSINNSGFSYRDDSSNSITSVVISGVNQITINLSGAPSTNAVVAYAYHNGAGGRQNQIDGLGDRGNIRDSSTDVSIYGDGYNLYNWLVTFREELN